MIENCSEGVDFISGGGAIYIGSMRKAILSNCLFAGNSSFGYGGVLSHAHAPLFIVNCTAHGNRAFFGQFISLRPHLDKIQSSVFIESSIVDDGENEIWLKLDRPDVDIVVEIRYSNMSNMSLPDIYDPDRKIFWGPDNLFVAPCFVAPGYWDNCNTPDDPNDDVFIEGDYHLKSQSGRWDPVSEAWIADDVTSPCVDAGDPLALLGDELYPHGDRINMGMYGGTFEASLSYTSELPPEPNVPESPDDPNEGQNTGTTGGGR